MSRKNSRKIDHKFHCKLTCIRELSLMIEYSEQKNKLRIVPLIKFTFTLKSEALCNQTRTTRDPIEKNLETSV